MILEWLKQQRRRRLRARPFPKEWLALVQRHVVFFHKLSGSDRFELLGHIQVFLAEKRFEGCGGGGLTGREGGASVSSVAPSGDKLFPRSPDDSCLSIVIHGSGRPPGW